MLKIINTAKKNILTSNGFHKVNFYGVSMRITENPFGKKYDKKIETTLYFKAFGGFYLIREKKEFKNNKLVRIRHTDEIAKSVEVIKNKACDSFKNISTFYFLPEGFANNFCLEKKENFYFDNAFSKASIYENEYITFTKDDGFNNERYFGIDIKEDSFEQTSREDFIATLIFCNFNVERI